MKPIKLFVILTMTLSAISAHALDVLSDPEFKECASMWRIEQRLSEECSRLWHTVEDRLQKDQNQARKNKIEDEEKERESLAIKRKTDHLAEIAKKKSLASRKIKELSLLAFCELYGIAIREEIPYDEHNYEDAKFLINLVKPEAKRRKLIINDALVISGRISIGTNKCTLYASLGQPSRENRSVGNWGEHIQHVYGNRVFIYTENGRVTSWQD